MSEKVMEKSESTENYFKFGIYLGREIVSEKIFSADSFNPVVRYSVDIRPMIPSIIQRLQKVFSKRNLNYIWSGNELEGYQYDLLKEYKRVTKYLNPREKNKLTRPVSSRENINGKIIRGVKMKFGLYINNNPIVERNFYVENYNPTVRFSTDLLEIVQGTHIISDDHRTDRGIVGDIYDYLKGKDVSHMWEDYDIINTYGVAIHQIRELNSNERAEMLNKIGNRFFVKQKRNYFKAIMQKQNQQNQTR